ncbi:MAG TPA: chemotaxis protein CheW [Candidatus Polarisedimenticolia bacterium]|nr:chemotaxis protein CheW [Candidatus Polarisedimenticolia bacterium]
MVEPIITFTSRSGWYGLEASAILEVAQLRVVRPVPRAPGIVAGLAEVHGRIVTLIDLDRLLAAGPAPVGIGIFGVVLAPPLDHLGVLVRSEVDVATAPAQEGSQPPQDETRGEEGGLLRARLAVGERLLNLLSLPALVSRVEAAIRNGFRPGRDATEEV